MELPKLSHLFGWGTPGPKDTEMPVIFPLPIDKKEFADSEVRFILEKILTDVFERMSGITEQVEIVLWDNCLQSGTSKGLITLIADAMMNQAELFIVYNKTLGTLREATSAERAKIKADYEKAVDSSTGVYLSFKTFDRAKKLNFYSVLEFLSVASLYKSSNLSKAIQYKVDSLRSSVALADAETPAAQARVVAEALGQGRDVLIDGKDTIETATPDISATEKAIQFLDSKRAFYLGMPLSYVNGTLSKGGLSDTGNSDARAIERGLKAYFFLLKPAVEKIFGIKVQFKSEEFGQLQVGIELLKTFELIGERFISAENKLALVNRTLGVESELGEEDPAPEQPARVPTQEQIPAPKKEGDNEP